MLEQGSRDLPQPLHLGGASEEGLVAHHGVATAAAVCIAEVPEEVDQALGGGKRQAVTITISGHAWNSRIAIMRSRYLIGLSSANRRAAGVATGDEVEVELDVEPRVVVEPTDFADALDADPAARSAYDRPSYCRKREHVRAIETAKRRETPSRRIDAEVASLRDLESTTD